MGMAGVYLTPEDTTKPKLVRLPVAVQERSPRWQRGLERPAEIEPKDESRSVFLLIFLRVHPKRYSDS